MRAYRRRKLSLLPILSFKHGIRGCHTYCTGGSEYATENGRRREPSQRPELESFVLTVTFTDAGLGLLSQEFMALWYGFEEEAQNRAGRVTYPFKGASDKAPAEDASNYKHPKWYCRNAWEIDRPQLHFLRTVSCAPRTHLPTMMGVT